jgi:hypothetical protein
MYDRVDSYGWAKMPLQLMFGTPSSSIDTSNSENGSSVSTNFRTSAMEVSDIQAFEAEPRSRSSWFLGLTSLVFVLLQSACTALMAISGVRLFIGMTAVASAVFVPGFMIQIHADRVRTPMMIIALLGASVNLFVTYRKRSLRSRPASRWRQKTITAKQRRSEIFQVALSVLAMVLVAIESLAHYHLHGSL